MLTTWKQVRGSWVLGKNSDPIGRIRDLVVNPYNGEIPALWIKTPDGTKLLAISEIQRWLSTDVYIESPADLISPEEFPRLKNVLENEVTIIGAPVFEILEKPKKIGHCINLTFETRSPRLLSIETQKGWFFWKKKRIITRAKIEEITSHGIFVTAPLLTAHSKEPTEIELLNNAVPEAKTSQSFRQD